MIVAACGADEPVTEGEDAADPAEESPADEPDAAPDGDPVNLTATSGVSAEHAWNVGFVEPWLADIEDATGGLVTADFFPGGELVALGQEYEPLTAGTIDWAFPMNVLYDPTRFPLSEVSMLPLVESDGYIAGDAYWDLIMSDEEFHDGMSFREYEYERRGFKVWPMPPTDVYVLSTIEPVESLSDLEGMAIRGSSRLHEMFVANWGATPTAIPSPELFDALSRGALDGTLFSVPDWTGYGFEELFKFSIEGLSIGNFTAVATMTQEQWDSLPEYAQEAIDATFEENYFRGVEEWMSRMDENRELYLENGGVFVDIADADPALRDAAEAAINDTWFDWIEELESSGEPGEKMARLWRDLLIEHGATVPDAVIDL